ncbi:MAG: helix-turn-helix transcriptional regulator [bacterium]
MAPHPTQTLTRIWPLVLLILIQATCTVVFVADVSRDLLPEGWASLGHLTAWSEIAATLGLVLGLVFESLVLQRLLQQQSRMQESLSVAAGALSDLMLRYFQTWNLTPTEQDVATFTIKGFSIAEIAELRGSAEGTIKTHLNAIYRKSGVTGRAQLVSVLVEDLLHAPLVPAMVAHPPLAS